MAVPVCPPTVQGASGATSVQPYLLSFDEQIVEGNAEFGLATAYRICRFADFHFSTKCFCLPFPTSTRSSRSGSESYFPSQHHAISSRAGGVGKNNQSPPILLCASSSKGYIAR